MKRTKKIAQPRLSETKVMELISTVMKHYEARIFLSNLPLSEQIEHLELEMYLRDTMVQAKHFTERVEELKDELKVKEIFLSAKQRGLLGLKPTSISKYRDAERQEVFIRKQQQIAIEKRQVDYLHGDSEDMQEIIVSPEFFGPPDLREKHTYCAVRYSVKRTDHANSHAPYDGVLEIALPVRHCYRLREARKLLYAEFPYALNVIDAVLRPIFSQERPGTVVHPTLIWGKPGLGKSRLARRICEVLGLHAEVISVAGMAEDFIFGVPLGFSTAKASIVTEGVRRSGSANPVIILDEVDKISDNRRFGSIHDRLLSHLERSESTRQFDPFLNAHVDSSKVGWILTANQLSSVPPVLQSRLTIVELDEPEAEHIPAILEGIRQEITTREQLSEHWCPKFLPFEVELLVSCFRRHKSIRILQRQAALVLSTRSTVQH